MYASVLSHWRHIKPALPIVLVAWHYKPFNIALILFEVLWAVWNGAKYYVDVFSVKYSKRQPASSSASKSNGYSDPIPATTTKSNQRDFMERVAGRVSALGLDPSSPRCLGIVWPGGVAWAPRDLERAVT